MDTQQFFELFNHFSFHLKNIFFFKVFFAASEHREHNDVDDVNNSGSKWATKSFLFPEKKIKSIDRNIITSTWLNSPQNLSHRIITLPQYFFERKVFVFCVEGGWKEEGNFREEHNERENFLFYDKLN